MLDYDALLERIAADRGFAPLCCEQRAGEIIIELVKALASGRRLTLVDAQLTPLERSHLGFDGPEVSRRDELPPFAGTDLSALIERCAASDGFELELVTSGSTGLPKRVAHRLASLTRTLRTGARHSEDVWALCYNPAHIAGVQMILQAWFNANAIVDLHRASPAAAWSALAEHEVTHISATPTFYRLLLAEATEPNCFVQQVTVGGESIDAALLSRLRTAFPSARIRNHYALTESGTVLVSEGDVFAVPVELNDRVKIEAGTLRIHRSLLGKFGEKKLKADGAREREDGRTAGATRNEAEGALSGCPTGSERHKADTGSGSVKAVATGARSAAPSELISNFSFSAFGVSAFSGDWYDTGDLVQVVSSDPLRVRFVGRDRDWVNVGGEKFNPAEIEAELRAHPAVSDVQVYGRANSVVGQILCARVVARGEVDEIALRDFLAGRIHSAKVPRLFTFIAAIGRGRTGKAAR